MKRHAYLILCHERSAVLEALLSMLDDERNDVYLHVDGKVPDVRHQLENMRLEKARLYVLPNPVSVYWGHSSLVKAELLLMRTAQVNGPYAYYHLLSGCDLPIKSQDEIHRFFLENEGFEFLSYWNKEKDMREAYKRTRYYYVLNRYKKRASLLQHALATPVRNILLALQKLVDTDRIRNNEWQIMRGSQWFSITEGCCRYVLNHEKEIWKMFRYTLCPDEIFMQTVIWNSPFREKLYDIKDSMRGSMRAIDWQRGNPYVWRREDVEYLVNSPYLFARKFSSDDMDIVKALTNCMYREEHPVSC